MAGLLDKASDIPNDPLFQMGVGLLAAGQKRPVSQPQQWGLLANAFNNAGRSKERAARTKLLTDKAKREREKDQRADTINARIGTLAARVGAGDMTPQAAMSAAAQFGPDGVGMLNEIITSGRESDPLAKFNAYAAMTPEQQAAYRNFESIGAARTTINNNVGGGGGELGWRPMTPQEGARFGVDDVTGLGVDRKGKPVAVPGAMDKNKKDREMSEAADQLNAAFGAYESAAQAYQGQSSPVGKERDIANQSKEALVAYIAKNVLGTPGAEPSPALYDVARTMVPDFAGPYDRAVFSDRLKALRAQANARFGTGKPEEGGAESEPAPKPGVLKYNPITGKIE